MHNFELRRDRFEIFNSFDNPLINLSFDLEVPDFRPWCKAQNLPPFHVFLYCVLHSIQAIDNFMYRILDGEVIRIDSVFASYTVLNGDNNLNFARFDMSDDLGEFVARSLQAKAVAEAATQLINTGREQSALDQRRHVHVTCIPWLQLTAIEHPVYRHKTADIPSLAWGRFSAAKEGMMTVPFSVQAHHGFVDGYHIHLLGQAVAQRMRGLMERKSAQ